MCYLNRVAIEICRQCANRSNRNLQPAPLLRFQRHFSAEIIASRWSGPISKSFVSFNQGFQFSLWIQIQNNLPVFADMYLPLQAMFLIAYAYCFCDFNLLFCLPIIPKPCLSCNDEQARGNICSCHIAYNFSH